ncbi:hypothetical protein TSMEX_007350 [Taenia solium]|eukprot:TsM_000722300 transcript=TsM_000722300 gene=TsM_000722300
MALAHALNHWTKPPSMPLHRHPQLQSGMGVGSSLSSMRPINELTSGVTSTSVCLAARRRYLGLTRGVGRLGVSI